MTDKDKLNKIKVLADKMYTSMQNLTTDTTPVRKAMDEYHKFIIYHLNEEPVSKDLDEAAKKYATSENPPDGITHELIKGNFIAGANWQKQQVTIKAEALFYHHMNDIGDVEFSDIEGFIDEFHKTMED